MSSILIVDDDADIQDIVSSKLAQAGYEVRTAADGEAALAAVAESRPDLLVLDVMMPRLSGLEVCRRLRDEAPTASIPIILLTAKAQEDDVERGFRLGVDDYVVKPFSPRELVRRVQAVLARAA